MMRSTSSSSRDKLWSHLAGHRGVVGADGNERGRNAGASWSHIHARGRSADALRRDVDALHNSSRDIM